MSERCSAVQVANGRTTTYVVRDNKTGRYFGTGYYMDVYWGYFDSIREAKKYGKWHATFRAKKESRRLERIDHPIVWVEVDDD